MNNAQKTVECEGRTANDEYWEKQFVTSEFHDIYEEEAAKKALWLQIVEVRQTAGLTQTEFAQQLGVSQAQVALLEQRGYDAYTLTELLWLIDAAG